MAKISKKLRIKWNFELTVFELTVPDLYFDVNEMLEISSYILDTRPTPQHLKGSFILSEREL